ncbi:MAG: NAD(P)-dependent alcohol dehydrogenase [Cohnella sp.]|nr:NAD(P)-dependent alcohol dehydrogenase [Cohnella sp.]
MIMDIPKTMKAAVLHQPLHVTIEERSVPRPGPGEALVKVMAVGVCGSDVHYYEHGRIGPYVVRDPLILGHECAGIVVACGEGADKFRPGDRVAIEPGVSCGRCDCCKRGRYNLCPDVRFLATPPVDGAFAQYIVHREDFLFPIPDQMTFEEAAMNEPFSVGIHAMNRAGFRPGQSVAVIGLGPVGLMAVAAAKAFGATMIIGCDREENRLEAARRLGAMHAVEAGADDVTVIRWLTGGVGVDVALETAGHPSAVQTAMKVTARGGKLSIVGLPPEPEVRVNVPLICDNELDIYGVFRYANTYPQGIRFLSSGVQGMDCLFTDRYPLEQAGEALHRAMTNKKGSLKVVVYPNEFPNEP